MSEQEEGSAFQPVPSLKQQQQPQAPDDRHGPGYDNDTPMTWVCGVKESGEGKPSFDSTAKRLSGGKHRDTP